MANLKPERICLYCGAPSKRGKKGEHVVPDAIGGALTLNDVPNRTVCQKCNSGVLSHLDRELCSRSHLSIIASRELGSHLWQAWDVDHEADNLLVEARPDWAADGSLNSLICYPQITFEKSGPEARGDFAEFLNFGRYDAIKVLFQAVRHCFGRYRDGAKSAINFEFVRPGVIYNGYRFAPRIYASDSINEVARNIRKKSFVLRFSSEEDKHFVLQSLPNLYDGSQLKKLTYKSCSYSPAICLFFDIGETVRGLMKLGLNLIAAFCPNTPVNHETFSRAIRIILGNSGQISPQLFKSNGFVHADDVRAIKGPQKSHSFRIFHMDGIWHVYSSFFGGQVGSYVQLPGPNHESWLSMDIVAPLGSKDWTMKNSNILQPMKAHVEWNDGRVVTPTFKLQKAISSVSVELKKKR